MLYGKENPTLKTRTQLSKTNNLDGLVALEAMDKDNTMSDTDETMTLGDEDDGFDDLNTTLDPEANTSPESSPTKSCLKPEHSLTSPNENSDSNPRFRHLFDQKMLIEKDIQDLDLQSLLMQCLDCQTENTVTHMYCHAAEVHQQFMCIYCLATFQNCRQLEIHLLREHRIQGNNFKNFEQFENTFRSDDVELFCADCSDSVTEDTRKHFCNKESRSVACTRCGTVLPMKVMLAHLKTCEVKSKAALHAETKMPLFMIKKQSEDTNAVSTEEASQAKSISVASSIPVKPSQASARLRNRDNRCKFCQEVVPPSKAAQHALQCRLRKPGKRPMLSPDLTVSRVPNKSSSWTVRRVVRDSVNDGSMNGIASDSAGDNDEEESSNSFSLTNVQEVTSDSEHQRGELPCETVTSLDAVPSGPWKIEPSDRSTDDSVELTKETAKTECDTTANMQVDLKPKLKRSFEDVILYEEDPAEILSILCEELINILLIQFGHKQQTMGEKMDTVLREIVLDRPLHEISCDDLLEMMTRDSSRCIYCRQVKLIGIDRRQLAVHLLSSHIYEVTVPQDTEKVESTELDVSLQYGINNPKVWGKALLVKIFQQANNVFNHPSRGKLGESLCECLLCPTSIQTQKHLFPHWIKSHPNTNMNCVMCQEPFWFVGGLYSHLCMGTPTPVISKQAQSQDERSTQIAHSAMMRYQCDYCSINELPGFFNLQVHLRNDHHVCELCLQEFDNQRQVMKHITSKHKLAFHCSRCGVSYEPEPFKLHNSWKHGTGSDSKTCKYCGQKKWTFSYHYCNPQSKYACDTCDETFSTYQAYRIHKRLHTGDKLRKCTYSGCDETFVSHKLLVKHIQAIHEVIPVVNYDEATENQQTDDTNEVNSSTANSIPEQAHDTEGDQQQLEAQRTDNIVPVPSTPSRIPEAIPNEEVGDDVPMEDTNGDNGGKYFSEYISQYATPIV